MSSPEALIVAIRDRIKAGKEKSEIKEEALQAGHSEEIFSAAYALAVASPNETSSALPRSYELWQAGWSFVFREWKLVAAVATPLALFSVLDFLAVEGVLNVSYPFVALLLGLCSVAVYVLGTLVALFKLSHEDDHSYRAALAWAKGKFWSFVLVYLLVSLIILGGYLLFIIPGIVVTVTLYFSIYAFAIDDFRKEAALVRSRELVKGKWWLLVRKLVGVGLYNFLIVLSLMIIGSLISLLAAGQFSETVNASAYIIASQFVGVALAIMMAAVGVQLYASFKEMNESRADISKRTGYRVLGVLGLIAFLGIIFAAGFLALNPEYLESELASEFIISTPLEAAAVAAYAEEFERTNGTYDGLCGALLEENLTTEADECNTIGDAFAVRISEQTDAVCVDSTGYQKELGASLGDRTSCLPI